MRCGVKMSRNQMSISGQFHKHLARVSAREKRKERVRSFFDPLHDRLLVTDLTRADPAGDVLQEFWIAGGMVEDQEALDLYPASDDQAHVERPCRRLRRVVDRNHPADRHAR